MIVASLTAGVTIMSTQRRTPQQGGEARSEGISYQELLDREQRDVPEVLRLVDCEDMGNEPIPAESYTSRAWHDAEMERMWPRVWQMVCREEEIPKVGDHQLYEIGTTSLLIVRSAEDRIQALHNVCLHRGRQLRTAGGCVAKFRCPFHGFTWNLDGTLREIPCEWDFPHIDKDGFSLPEAKVDTWGGFVFVNLDGQAPPLEEYLGVIPEHFERWKLEDCVKAVHVQKRVACNWKVLMEAFIESWHSLATHPQILPYTADANSQYDTFGPNVSRTITAMGVPSPHTPAVAEQEIINALHGTSGRMTTETGIDLTVPEGLTAREHMADINRSEFGGMFGMDLSDATDAEVLDAVLYSAFPNFVPWAGYNPNIVYRFRPDGDDPDAAIMDVMILMRVGPDVDRPSPCPVNRLGDDEPWSSAEELGGLGVIFDQDMGNLPFVQKGLKSSPNNQVQLGSYQEARIRHLHRTLDGYLGREA
jgi:phenylpropionate dioxygenase-like ring-hydroxylating dioxygenase large terminal subunit